MKRARAIAAGFVSALGVLSCLSGCSSPSPSVGTSRDDLTGASAVTWTNIGYGINSATVGAGPNVLVVYGGYSATDADSEALSLQYVSAELGALGVGQVYAVRGPEDAGYDAREIGNSHLATQLDAMAGSIGFVAIVAHSSGGFVADELFTFVSQSVMSKIAYFNLDGGSWALTDAMVKTMRGVYFCGAHDSAAGYSENWSSDESLHSAFAGSHLFLVDADGSGCNDGAGWCLHDTLITTRPHNPATYDLDDDYTDFTGAGRHVVVSYMQQAIADGALPAGAFGTDAGSPPPSTQDSGTPPVDAGASDAHHEASSSNDCELAGQTYAQNTCTETLQCDLGSWVARTNDPSSCIGGVEPNGGCITDSGSVVADATCTSTLQCQSGVWVDREDDRAACL